MWDQIEKENSSKEILLNQTCFRKKMMYEKYKLPLCVWKFHIANKKHPTWNHIDFSYRNLYIFPHTNLCKFDWFGVKWFCSRYWQYLILGFDGRHMRKGRLIEVLDGFWKMGWIWGWYFGVIFIHGAHFCKKKLFEMSKNLERSLPMFIMSHSYIIRHSFHYKFQRNPKIC